MSTAVYIATIKAAVPQLVRCEHCGQEFVYFMRKSGVAGVERVLKLGWEDAVREAAEVARRELESKLNVHNFNVVPCRHCFRFQSYMRDQAAEQKFGHNRMLGPVVGICGAVLVALAVLAVFSSGRHREVALWVGGAGAGVILLGCWLHRRLTRLLAEYDPNALPESERERLAAERGMTWAEFDGAQTDRVREQYHEEAARWNRERWCGSSSGGRPVIRYWLMPQSFVDGLSLSIRLSETDEMTLAVPPGTCPGTTFDLHTACGFPLRVLALALLDTTAPARPSFRTGNFPAPDGD